VKYNLSVTFCSVPFFVHTLRAKTHERICTINGSKRVKSAKDVAFWGFCQKNWVILQFRLTNSQRYLVNAKPHTNHSTIPTNHKMVTVSGNPNPTNPTTKYRCVFVNLSCKITKIFTPPKQLRNSDNFALRKLFFAKNMYKSWRKCSGGACFPPRWFELLVGTHIGTL